MRIYSLLRQLNAAFPGKELARHQEWFEGASSTDVSGEVDHAELVREYYEVCTEFMVFGWGESLHFAPLSPRLSLEESQIRHQRSLIESLQLEAGMQVIDVGCGIGGPMRRVVREAGVHVLGVNINEHQLNRAKALNEEAELGHMVDYLGASFMDMSAIADGAFDRAYAIESTCHAPDKQGAFAEIFRVLKPGALFWCQEMCMTDVFDPEDSRHQEIKAELKRGIALHEIATTGEVNQTLEAVGFELVEHQDLGVVQPGASTPWYQPMLSARGTRRGSISRSPLGRRALIAGAQLAEWMKILPDGSASVISMMDRTARAYVAGGQTGIFTPLYCFLARKPL
ncbi:MAG: class I SAM-dependent methyltransferase [Chloroflexota bacterium]|nr:class I SAM-dependent methyltransferase [Chloroflexota bacterium]MDE2895402.1 class I SAM-dependent methyltransferase [Chloroflexota bacterium]